MQQSHLATKHIVLMGVGHTHAHIVRMWSMHALPDTDLTCISISGIATYSGMLPAVLAGLVEPSEMEIDLVRLCQSAGARLICERVTGIDHERREVGFADRPPVPFDVLSIGIGSVPSLGGIGCPGRAWLPIKPMQDFLPRLGAKLAECNEQNRDQNQPLRIFVVGGGLAGVELLFCLQAYTRRQQIDPVELTLVTRGKQMLAEMQHGVRRKVGRAMQRRGLNLLTGKGVVAVGDSSLTLDDGQQLPADLVVWATGAAAPETLRRLGLPLTEHGFLETDATLRTTAGYPVFAVGDSGSIRGYALHKAGVYAVRQGPILWDNLQRSLKGEALREFRPQKHFLRLLNLGDGTAIGQRRRLSFQGRWVYGLKHWIDSGFMEKFAIRSMADDGQPMQCAGCGCKLGAKPLHAAVARFDSGKHVVAEDAAEVGRPGQEPLMATTDFFTSPFTDPYLAGRVAALHSASDLLACGATATDALANVVVPEGERMAQQEFLANFMEGARRAFGQLGVRIVGGHTIVGPRFEAGFTVLGVPGSSVLRKSQLQVGDRLYLTKPIGTGVLLAAHMRARCPASCMESLLASMLDPGEALPALAIQSGSQAATDVTGFGLAGHLLEMLQASGVSAEIEWSQVPLLPGAAESLRQGITSSLEPENRSAFQPECEIEDVVAKDSSIGLLFDPQTCGGLLLAIPQAAESRFQGLLQVHEETHVNANQTANASCAYRIGTVVPCGDGQSRLYVR